MLAPNGIAHREQAVENSRVGIAFSLPKPVIISKSHPKGLKADQARPGVRAGRPHANCQVTLPAPQGTACFPLSSRTPAWGMVSGKAKFPQFFS
jgi:hypothetical protein